MTSGFTLHRVRDVGHLERLARTMANCLASYHHRLDGRHRIVEVRQGGSTRYAVHVTDGRIETFEAAGNRRPDPADVPMVRKMLVEAGHLAATRRPPSSPHRPGPTSGQAQLDLGRPPRAANPSTAPASPRTRTPAHRAASVPTLSLQQLATDLLDPHAIDPPSWSEVAAALWMAGILPALPDPTEAIYERVVLDLAARLVVGGPPAPGAAAPTPPNRGTRVRARDQLLASLDHVTEVSWQRRRMADILATALGP